MSDTENKVEKSARNAKNTAPKKRASADLRKLQLARWKSRIDLQQTRD